MFLEFQNGEIPLHFAAREGHLRTVRLLLADKAIPDLLNIVRKMTCNKIAWHELDVPTLSCL